MVDSVIDMDTTWRQNRFERTVHRQTPEPSSTPGLSIFVPLILILPNLPETGECTIVLRTMFSSPSFSALRASRFGIASALSHVTEKQRRVSLHVHSSSVQLIHPYQRHGSR